MKTISVILFLISSCAFCGETKLVVNSTYPDGFGVIFQKEMHISRKADDNGSTSHKFILHIQGERPDTVDLECNSVRLYNMLVKLLKDGNGPVKVKAVGYEEVRSLGAPGMSKTSPSEASGDYLVPQGDKWRIEKVIRILAIEPAS
jgi:hypothetical protein